MKNYLTEKNMLLVELYLMEYQEEGHEVVSKRNYTRSTRMLKNQDERYIALQTAIAINNFERKSKTQNKE